MIGFRSRSAFRIRRASVIFFFMSGIGQEIRRYSEVRLRRFESTEFGGSRETILALYPNGQFEYVEIEQYEGSGSSRHPGSGTWDAEGDLSSGALILRWSSGDTTQHSFYYAGGETCQVDGHPAYISAN
jgi:hypothetical protein